MSNIGSIDRILRALLGIILLQLAFFWLGGVGQIVAGAAGAVMLLTAGASFCPLYRMMGMNTLGRIGQTGGKAVAIIGLLVLVAVAIGGSYASNFFTRKLFLEDFNAMNHYYKQTLFLTGKNERAAAIENYDKLLPAYKAFQQKYSDYRPFALKGDSQLGADLAKVSEMLAGVATLVRTGDLHQAHLDLEKVRPVFQDMFKRNGFSMLAVALVDFHDAMELMLDAGNAKDDKKLVALYAQVSDKLKVVEAEANDAEIQLIRKNLDELLGAAKAGQREQLPQKADALKSSFVKVYLKRG